MSIQIDIQTLEALRNGDHKAFQTVFISYYNVTRNFIFGYIKSEADAEELAEELFVNLWMNRQTIDTSKSFHSYLHTIARNASINFLRRKYLHDTCITQLLNTDFSTTSEEELIAKELSSFIDRVVEKMPEQRRKIYELSRNEGLSNTEIAERLATSKRNVESQLSYALKEIRKAISIFFLIFPTTFY